MTRPLRIAVVTPYHREPLAVIQRCHDSVRAQTVPAEHLLVADGYPRVEIEQWPALHLMLPPPGTADVGSTPKLVGGSVAAARGYDAIALLDADNWYEPDHLHTLLRAAQAHDAAIVTCARTLRRPDGSALGLCTESEGDRFNDSNCYLLLRPAFPLLMHWGFIPRPQIAIGDRVFWQAVRQSPLRRVHSPQPTVNYETTFVSHYLERGETPPAQAKAMARVNGAWQLLPLPIYEALRDAAQQRPQGTASTGPEP